MGLSLFFTFFFLRGEGPTKSPRYRYDSRESYGVLATAIQVRGRGLRSVIRLGWILGRSSGVGVLDGVPIGCVWLWFGGMGV